MLPPLITRLRGERNTAGGCRIELVPVDGVAVMPAEVSGTIPIGTPIVLATGYSWTVITPTRATQVFGEDWTPLNGARMSRASLEWVISKDRAQLLAQLWELRRMRCLVIHYDENGSAKLMGTQAEPAIVTVTELQHGNGPGQGENKYVLRASSVRGRMCPFYLPTTTGVVPLPPPGCPPMSYLIANAIPADILAAFTHEQLAYFTEYFNAAVPCPTLAELVGTSTVAQILSTLSGEQQAEVLNILGEFADYLEDPLTATTDVLVDPL